MGVLDRNVSETQIKLRSRLWLYILSAIILFLLIVPSLVVIPMSFSSSQYLEFPPKEWSFRWYENYFFSWKVENGFNLNGGAADAAAVDTAAGMGFKAHAFTTKSTN